MGAAAHMSSEGVPVVGIPKTIDNDLSGTDACIGFATAVQVATDAIDRLHTTAESHDRLMVVEVMGRSAGWIALSSGIAGWRGLDPAPGASLRPGRGRLGAPAPPPRPGTPSRSSSWRRGRCRPRARCRSPEYPMDPRGAPRFGGIAYQIAPRLEALTGGETRVTVLGHVQRGGSPVAADRIVATRFGVAATDLIAQGGFGQMVAPARRPDRRRCRSPRPPRSGRSPRSSSPSRSCSSRSGGAREDRHPDGRRRRPGPERVHQGRHAPGDRGGAPGRGDPPRLGRPPRMRPRRPGVRGREHRRPRRGRRPHDRPERRDDPAHLADEPGEGTTRPRSPSSCARSTTRGRPTTRRTSSRCSTGWASTR